MAIPGYMSLTDDAGNSIKGSVIVKDRENQIEVLGLYHNGAITLTCIMEEH